MRAGRVRSRLSVRPVAANQPRARSGVPGRWFGWQHPPRELVRFPPFLHAYEIQQSSPSQRLNELGRDATTTARKRAHWPHRPRRVASEVLWAVRIDPGRAVLRSVLTPSRGHRQGGLALHNGAGTRTR